MVTLYWCRIYYLQTCLSVLEGSYVVGIAISHLKVFPVVQDHIGYHFYSLSDIVRMKSLH